MLRGYKTREAIARLSGAPLDIILVHVTPQGKADGSGLGHHDASARIVRVKAHAEGEGVCQEVCPSRCAAADEEGGLTLLNALYAPPESPLGQVLSLMLRLDNISHVLVWGTTAEQESMELVELPRLGLAFRVRPATAGRAVVLESLEHDGLVVSNRRSKEVELLMHGMPHAILLEDVAGDVFILASSAACPSTSTASSPAAAPPSSTPAEASGSGRLWRPLMLDRGNEHWLANCSSVRHYVYPVHISKRFLVMPSLAAAMSLMLMKLLHGCYEEAVRLAPACVSDTALGPEEAQLWSKLELIANDAHADAVACRLRISLATSASSATVPWSVGEELRSYCRVQHKVASACRLTVPEEMELLAGTRSPCLRCRSRAATPMSRLLRAPTPSYAPYFTYIYK